MEQKELPNKLSSLLTLALDDLLLAEADPRYRVDMRDWHHFDGEYCNICLAGAVLAFSLNESLEDNELVKARPVWNKLWALDELRKGYVDHAARELRLSYLKWPMVSIPSYEEDRYQFHSSLRRLASDLATAGL